MKIAEVQVEKVDKYKEDRAKQMEDLGKILDPRMTADIEAGHDIYKSWTKKKSRDRAVKHRKDQVADRAHERIEQDNKWFEWWENQEVTKKDVTWEGPEDGIEDDEVVEERKVRAPLNDAQIKKFKCEAEPPWRKKAAQKYHGIEWKEQQCRKWSSTKRTKGPEARANSLWRLQEKISSRSQQTPADDEEEDFEEGEINLLCTLNGLSEHDFEYVRENLLIDSGASICGCPKKAAGEKN